MRARYYVYQLQNSQFISILEFQREDYLMTKSLNIIFALALAGSASACATTPPTAEQRASCEEMLAKMGEGATHSHSADKGSGVNTMGITHAQCRRMLDR